MAKIAFIGLGHMGLPMARNLLKAGHAVTGVDLSAEARDAFAAAGGQVGEAAGPAAAGVEAVVTMLPAGRHVEAVYGGEDGVLAAAAPGTLLIDSSTIDVATARSVADQARAAGCEAVDAPVSGGVGGAEAGTLTFMVGGSEAGFARAQPILSAMGKAIVHAGGAGTGQAAKMCNNMLLAISMIGTAEAFALADALELDRQRLFDIASTASGQCWSLTSYCPVPGPVPTSPANRDYQPGFAVALMLKDLSLAIEAAEARGAQTPLGRHARELYAQLAEDGHGGLDFSGIFKRLTGAL